METLWLPPRASISWLKASHWHKNQETNVQKWNCISCWVNNTDTLKGLINHSTILTLHRNLRALAEFRTSITLANELKDKQMIEQVNIALSICQPKYLEAQEGFETN
jgi:hypothetical protein